MIAEPAHRLGLALHPREPSLVQTLSLDDGDRYVSIESVIVGQIDALAAALTEESFYRVAPAG
jgi:hypothetical protein